MDRATRRLLCAKLAINLISLGTFLLQGCRLTSKNSRHAVVKNDSIVMYVHIKHNALVVDRGIEKDKSSGVRDIIMNAIEESEPRDTKMQRASLMSFHRRFGHLNYEDAERLAANRANGIELTDRIRENCIACTEGKQTKTAQSKKDSGLNAPINVVG